MVFKKKTDILTDLDSKNLYQILDVDRHDPSGIIYDNYLDKLKTNRKAKDTTVFNALKVAFNTIYDPDERKRYDNLLTCGNEVEGFLNQAYAAIIHGHLKSAELSVKKIASLTNNAPEALILLAEIQLKQRKFKTVLNTLRSLVDLFPNTIFYHDYLAGVLLSIYNEPDIDMDKKQILADVRKEFEVSIALDPAYVQSYLGLAHSYAIEEDYDSALNALNRGIEVDKLDKHRDFVLQIFRCRCIASKGDIEELRDQLLVLEDYMPENQDNMIDEFHTPMVIGTCVEIIKLEKYEEAKLIALTAVRMSPGDPSLCRFTDEIERIIQMLKAKAKLEQDSTIIKPIRDMACKMVEYHLTDDTEMISLASHDCEIELDEHSEASIRKSLKNLELNYPVIYNLNPKYWKWTKTVMAGSSCGIIFYIAAILAVYKIITMIIDYLFYQ